MRTTLTLDEDLAEELNRLARRFGRSFKQVVNETIRRGLATGERPVSGNKKPFRVEPSSCGFQAGVDPLRLNQLLDEFDVERFRAKHAARGDEP